MLWSEYLCGIPYAYVTTIIAYDAFTNLYELEVPVPRVLDEDGRDIVLCQIVMVKASYIRTNLVK